MPDVIEARNLFWAEQDIKKMPLFRWEDIDHRLVVLKLVDLSEEMRNRIKADESRIRFENRFNFRHSIAGAVSYEVPAPGEEEKQGRIVVLPNHWASD